jgi:predicted outer membrane repeat protein
VYFETGELLLTRSVMNNNTAAAASAFGGAISCSANCVLPECCSITVNNGTLNGNYAGAGGGAVRARARRERRAWDVLHARMRACAQRRPKCCATRNLRAALTLARSYRLRSKRALP